MGAGGGVRPGVGLHTRAAGTHGRATTAFRRASPLSAPTGVARALAVRRAQTVGSTRGLDGAFTQRLGRPPTRRLTLSAPSGGRHMRSRRA